MWLTFALFAALLWGLNYALAEKVLYSIAPTTLLALEMLCGAVFFSIISYFTDLKKDLISLSNEPRLLWLTVAEVIIVLIASYFIVSSIRLKNATVAGIIELIYPLFTIFFTWFLFQENHLNWPVILGGCFIVCGVLIISLS